MPTHVSACTLIRLDVADAVSELFALKTDFLSSFRLAIVQHICIESRYFQTLIASVASMQVFHVVTNPTFAGVRSEGATIWYEPLTCGTLETAEPATTNTCIWLALVSRECKDVMSGLAHGAL